MPEPVLRRTARAEQDLIDIGTYVSQYNPNAAERLVGRLEDASLALARNPYLGMARSDIRPSLRHFPVGNYLILYRVIEGGAEIVRYVHGRRRLSDAI